MLLRACRMTSGVADAATVKPKPSGELRLIDWAERYGLSVALLVLVVVFSVLRPETFFTWSNLSTILGSQAVLVVVTLGLIVPLTANDFDLSIAYVMTLSAMMVALLNGQDGWPVGWAVLG